MATVGQIYYNVIDKNSGECISSGPDIFKDIVAGYPAQRFKKIGVQAKPGTLMIINDKQPAIMVGATGIYELDDEITVESMRFVRPPKYEKNEEKSNAAIVSGGSKMSNAEKDRDKSLVALGDPPQLAEDRSNIEQYSNYWNEYSKIQTTFIAAYNDGLKEFQPGRYGIYDLPNPTNIDAPENYEDLYNVIIDFLYE